LRTLWENNFLSVTGFRLFRSLGTVVVNSLLSLTAYSAGGVI